uniref:Uncharacterized protein n=1 Tax=Meloidogyne floridensis TaxID=298350 RepID=A0A915NEK7_9BILA
MAVQAETLKEALQEEVINHEENKLVDNNEEWRPLHMHEVVAVAM